MNTSDRAFIAVFSVCVIATAALCGAALSRADHGGWSSISLPAQVTIMMLGAVSGALLFCSFAGLISYAGSLSSFNRDGHAAMRVHAPFLMHPIYGGLLIGLLAVCAAASSPAAWGAWVVGFLVYGVRTVTLTRKVQHENSAIRVGFLTDVFGLVLGSELMTSFAGGRSLSPRKLGLLPENTWIVDVRTKAEFGWNRLRGAENYPWGQGLEAAAQEKSRETPVLVACFSGHRSPAAAVLLRNLGFQHVYNLSWGILYLILSGRGQGNGPLGLVRQDRRSNMRGRDYRGISIAYVALIFASLIGAPTEWYIWERHPAPLEAIVGAALLALGVALGGLSFRALGRNFRVFAAPRRSGALIRQGVYRRVRHPMYTGVVFGLLGYDLLWGSLFFLPAWAAVTVLYLVKAVKEERLLAAKYSDYEEYRTRSWMFIPYVY